MSGPRTETDHGPAIENKLCFFFFLNLFFFPLYPSSVEASDSDLLGVSVCYYRAHNITGLPVNAVPLVAGKVNMR